MFDQQVVRIVSGKPSKKALENQHRPPAPEISMNARLLRPLSNNKKP